MFVLGYVESDHVMDEYELAERLGKFFCEVEVEEGEVMGFSPQAPVAKAAHLAGSDEYDRVCERWDMPDDEPASPSQVELAKPPAIIISALGEVFRSHGASLPCSLVPGHRYHSFVTKLS